LSTLQRPRSGNSSRRAKRGGPGLLVTLPWRDEQGLHNSVALIADGHAEIRSKHELPNYGVFDEKRVFVPGGMPEPMTFRGALIGVPICEDIWLADVVGHLARCGAELLIVPNGSPFEVDQFDQRLDLARARVTESGLPLIYVNQVGGQDELVFDGGSFAINTTGEIAHLMPFWTEALDLARWDRASGQVTCCDRPRADFTPEPRLSAVYHAMMLGLRDYVDKNRFPGVVLGLSGGIDSALTAVVAVDALGAKRVRGVRLPSPFTSEASMVDAADTARLLGITLETLPIDSGVQVVEETLAPVFAGGPETSRKRTFRPGFAPCC
jgi:NAD+ synthase